MNLSMNNQPMKTNSMINLPGSGISRLFSVRRNTTVSLCCWLSACLLLLLTPCRADFATPFVEINKNVGEVSECYGYIVVLGPELNTQFLVIVRTDTSEHLVLSATAKNGVVTAPLLGRWLEIKAVVTKAGSASGKPELEILHCELMKQKAAPLTITVADLRDDLIGRTVAVTVRSKSTGGGPTPPPGTVTDAGEGLRITGILESFSGDTIALRFPPPATFGKHNIHKPGVTAIEILPQENRQPGAANGDARDDQALKLIREASRIAETIDVRLRIRQNKSEEKAITRENLIRIKQFILQQGKRETYCNMYNNNPAYLTKGYGFYLNPDSGQDNINCDPKKSDFNNLTIRNATGRKNEYLTVEFRDVNYVYITASYPTDDLTVSRIRQCAVDALKEILVDIEKTAPNRPAVDGGK